MRYSLRFIFAFLILQARGVSLAQSHGAARLDPTLEIATPVLESTTHSPLPEQYIWSDHPGDAGETTFLYFRKSFALKSAPRVATLYAAGPNWIRVYVNGRLMANGIHDAKERIRPFVLSIDLTGELHAGRNVVAVMASEGESMVLKIIAAPLQVTKPPLVITDATWKCDFRFHGGWEAPSLNDRSWPDAKSLGSVEEKSQFFAGNKDAGMYQWPGYDGISPFLAHTYLKPTELAYGFEGMGRLTNVSALRLGPFAGLATGKPHPAAKTAPYSRVAEVFLPGHQVAQSEYPYLVVGFGKECPGRIRVISASPAPMRLEVQYGESIEEASGNPYLGANEIYVPPYGTAYGPKSSFAYALIRFLGGASPLRFKSIDVDYIYYPVKQLGSFESSDPVLDSIWQVGAYTAHVCMQDRILDGAKRDRVCLAGGLDVSGRVISTVFGDRFLLGQSLKDLIAAAGSPVNNHVNFIPGFSALWVMCEADYIRHSGDMAHLRSVHDSLLALLAYMAGQIDENGRLRNSDNHSTFIDWSPDLEGDSVESRRVTMMEFLRAFSEGAWLLEQAGDGAASENIQRVAEKLRGDLLKDSLDPTTNIFGNRWQTNAMAVYSGLADAGRRAAVWENILSRPYHFTVTPHLNFYALCAMAAAGRRQEALEWIRDYWGGMLRSETTTFWEGYDPRWPKEHFHGHLQTDHGEGYFVSLCHGWSSGPTAWLTEQVLGIQPQAAGFTKVAIRPDLCGLKWARGAEPCPQGLVKVDYLYDASGFKANIEIPDGVTAEVYMPVNRGESSLEVDGHPLTGAPAEDGTRLCVALNSAGLHELHSRVNWR
jgi:hypothetical protein